MPAQTTVHPMDIDIVKMCVISVGNGVCVVYGQSLDGGGFDNFDKTLWHENIVYSNFYIF